MGGISYKAKIGQGPVTSQTHSDLGALSFDSGRSESTNDTLASLQLVTAGTVFKPESIIKSPVAGHGRFTLDMEAANYLDFNEATFNTETAIISRLAYPETPVSTIGESPLFATSTSGQLGPGEKSTELLFKAAFANRLLTVVAQFYNYMVEHDKCGNFVTMLNGGSEGGHSEKSWKPRHGYGEKADIRATVEWQNFVENSGEFRELRPNIWEHKDTKLTFYKHKGKPTDTYYHYDIGDRYSMEDNFQPFPRPTELPWTPKGYEQKIEEKLRPACEDPITS